MVVAFLQGRAGWVGTMLNHVEQVLRASFSADL
jgi:hypothetical protein